MQKRVKQKWMQKAVAVLLLAVMMLAVLPSIGAMAAPEDDPAPVADESTTSTSEEESSTPAGENTNTPSEVTDPPAGEETGTPDSTAADPADGEADATDGEEADDEEADAEGNLFKLASADEGTMAAFSLGSPLGKTFNEYFAGSGDETNAKRLAEFVAYACSETLTDNLYMADRSNIVKPDTVITPRHIELCLRFDADRISSMLGYTSGSDAKLSSIEGLEAFVNLKSIEVVTTNTDFTLSAGFTDNLTKLTEFNIMYSSAPTSLPEEIFNSSTVKTVRLVTASVDLDTQFRHRGFAPGTGATFSGGISMPSLETLVVNGLKTLPPDLKSMFPNAKKMDFSFGYLTEIDTILPDTLTELDFTANCVSRVSSDIMARRSTGLNIIALHNAFIEFNTNLVNVAADPFTSDKNAYELTIPLGAPGQTKGFFEVKALDPDTLAVIPFSGNGNSADYSKYVIDTSYDHDVSLAVRLLYDSHINSIRYIQGIPVFNINIRVGAGGDFSNNTYTFDSGGSGGPINIINSSTSDIYATFCIDRDIPHSTGDYLLVTSPQEIADQMGMDLEGLYRLRYAAAHSSLVLSKEELDAVFPMSTSRDMQDAIWTVVEAIKGTIRPDHKDTMDLEKLKFMYDPSDPNKAIRNLESGAGQTVALAATGATVTRQAGAAALLGPYKVNTAPVSSTLLFDAAITPSGDLQAADVSLVNAAGSPISGQNLRHGDQFYVKVAATAGDGSVAVALTSQSDTVSTVYKEYLFTPSAAAQRVYGIERVVSGISAEAVGAWSTDVQPDSSSSSSSSTPETPSSSVPYTPTDVPQTGDNAPIILFIALAAVCAVTIPVLVLAGKKYLFRRKR